MALLEWQGSGGFAGAANVYESIWAFYSCFAGRS